MQNPPSSSIAVFQPSSHSLVDGGSLSFGSVKKGLKYTKTFTIKNFGTGRLRNIDYSLSGSGAFHIDAPDLAFLRPGEKLTFTVSFSPKELGLKHGHLRIASNDADENPFDIYLSGTGIASSSALASSSFSTMSASVESSTTQNAGQLSYTTDTEGLKHLVLTVEKSNVIGAAVPTVEVSSNLMDWYSGSNYTTILVDSASVLKVKDNTPITGGEMRYIRVKNSGR
jgi:hypothetical protein